MPSAAVERSRDGASLVEVFCRQKQTFLNQFSASEGRASRSKPMEYKGCNCLPPRAVKDMSVTAVCHHARQLEFGVSADACDKYFPVAVASLTPQFAPSWSSKVVALEAAGVALSFVAVDLATATPNMRACSAISMKAIFSALRRLQVGPAWLKPLEFAEGYHYWAWKQGNAKCFLLKLGNQLSGARSLLQK